MGNNLSEQPILDNKYYLALLSVSHPPLNYFSMKGSMLIFNNPDNNTMYMLPLSHIKLNEINPKIYELNAKDIYRILYVLELFYKIGLNESDIDFVTQFTNKYISLENERLANNRDELLTYCMSIPIYTSYDPEFIESEVSEIMHKLLLENNSGELREGNNKGNVLVLKPKTPIYTEEDEPPYYELPKAGFATLVLIIATVLVTTLYVLFFIQK